MHARMQYSLQYHIQLQYSVYVDTATGILLDLVSLLGHISIIPHKFSYKVVPAIRYCVYSKRFLPMEILVSLVHKVVFIVVVLSVVA